jgi:ATP-dependent helicase/nuclease subunit A
MAKEWTKPQKKAIYERNRGILVSAAAGSGKTSVLTERVVSLIKEGGDISRMLIVTFTNAAAAEMRSRIKLRLSELLLENPDSNHLRQQMLLIPSAQISTMHAFCLNLAKEHYDKTGISPAAKIGEEGEINSLKYEAAVAVLRDYVSSEEALLMLNPSKSDGELIKNIVKIYEYIASAAFMEKEIDNLESLLSLNTPFLKSIYYPILKENAVGDISYFLSLYENIKEEAKNISLETLDELSKTADQDIALLLRIKELLENDNYEEFRLTLECPFVRLSSIKSSVEIADKFKLIRDAAKKKLKAILGMFSYSLSEYEEDMKILYPTGRFFFDLIRKYIEVYKELKREKEIIDFSDVEHIVIKLFYNSDGTISDFAKELSEEFDEIMVDEFQDTNETQYAIFSAISKNEQNLFTVGDVKQSIYRFRLADPTIFLNRKENADKTPLSPTLISLSDNFRSSRGVCDTINEIFSGIMSKEVGEMEYEESDHLKTDKKDKIETEIIIAENNSEEAEALAVAERIKKLIKEGIEVDGEKANIKYEDIAVLMATRDSFSAFFKVFRENKIPFVSGTSEHFLETRECDSLLSLLKTIDNPCYDMHFAASFLSPVFGFTADDLVALKAQNKRTLYEAAKESGNERVLAFAKLLKNYRLNSFTLSAADIIKKIFYDTSYIEIFSAFSGGENTRINLMKMLEIAEKDDGGRISLREYIKRIDKWGENAAKSSDANTTSNAVKIMTIHGSKGLEFTVCFVSDTARAHRTETGKDPVLVHKKLGLATKIIDIDRHTSYTTAPREAIKVIKTKELLSEKMRVLYVALTRAKQKLIITASLKDRYKYLSVFSTKISRGDILPAKIMSAKNDLEWVLFGVLEPKKEALDKVVGSAGIKNGISAKIIFPAEEVEKEKEEIGTPAEPSSEILKILNDAKEFSYENKGIEKIPVRLSVSDISKKNSEVSFISRPSFAALHEASAAEKGTVVHKFMQYADYKNAYNSLDDEINRLLELEFLNSNEVEILDRKLLSKFFNSSLYQRILNADEIYREYSFMFSKNAGEIMETEERFKNEKVLIQGIADCIIIENGEFTVIDYKTDNVKSEEVLIERYAPQLSLYLEALEEKLKMSAKEKIIYSFKLGKEIKL